MNQYENLAFIITFAAYSVAMLFYVWCFVSKRENVGQLASIVTIVGSFRNTHSLDSPGLCIGGNSK